MWNGKCDLANEPSSNTLQVPTNLTIRNGQANDTTSMRSISSEDISTADVPTTCCSLTATNPAIKSGRRFQLLQVCFRTYYISLVIVHIFVEETFFVCISVCFIQLLLIIASKLRFSATSVKIDKHNTELLFQHSTCDIIHLTV